MCLLSLLACALAYLCSLQLVFSWATSNFTNVSHMNTAEEFAFDWQVYGVMDPAMILEQV